MHKGQTVDTFVERLGSSLEEDGLPRIAGRMFALFVLEGGPLSFAELAERLQVSRGSVSTNARLLRALGVLTRITQPGERQDYYVLTDDPYGQLLDGYIARMRHRNSLIDELLEGLPSKDESRPRLKELRDFYSEAIESTSQLGSRVRQSR